MKSSQFFAQKPFQFTALANSSTMRISGLIGKGADRLPRGKSWSTPNVSFPAILTVIGGQYRRAATWFFRDQFKIVLFLISQVAVNAG
jgi:hypothetical protein